MEKVFQRYSVSDSLSSEFRAIAFGHRMLEYWERLEPGQPQEIAARYQLSDGLQLEPWAIGIAFALVSECLGDLEGTPVHFEQLVRGAQSNRQTWHQILFLADRLHHHHHYQ